MQPQDPAVLLEGSNRGKGLRGKKLFVLAQWVAGAVEANSLHVLRHLGITHLLNATEDLLMPDPGANFR